jgi:uncharacterized protein
VSDVRIIATEAGEARLHTDRAKYPKAAVALGHGAGRGVDAPDLVALAAALPRRGITVFRIEQPWVLAGRKVAPRPEVLDIATVACVDAIRVRCPLILGGRSAGARSACRLARRLGAVGCLALAFPLHPPGKPERSRVDELRRVGLATLVVQGERDAFGGPGDLPSFVQVAPVAAADHGFAVPARAGIDQAATLAGIVDAVSAWVLGLVLVG